jgi:ankyrin repeat protein
MPPPALALELLLMIAHQLRDDNGHLRYGDFNSFLQVNRVLHSALNRTLWKEAAEHEVGTQRVFTHLLTTGNNPAGLSFFLELGANTEASLPIDFKTFIFRDTEKHFQSRPTPLMVAVLWNKVPLARILLANGAKAEHFYENGLSKMSPIHVAQSAEMVQLLLTHNVNPNLEEDSIRRPIHWCAMRNNIAAMRELLRHGAEVNPGGWFATPVHDAAKMSLEAVECLVEHGADVRVVNRWGVTSLHTAVEAGKLDVVKFLVEHWPEGVREKDCLSRTPLHYAVTRGYKDMAKFLEEQCPEVLGWKDCDGNTPYNALFRENVNVSIQAIHDIRLKIRTLQR